MSGKHTLILLAEDNPGDSQLALYALGEAGLAPETVHRARDGEAAVQFLFGDGPHAGRDTTQQPKLAILDIQMPKLNGLEVLERMKADPRTREIPAVIFTSSLAPEDRERARTLGADGFINKPMDFEKFTAEIQSLVTRWLKEKAAA